MEKNSKPKHARSSFLEKLKLYVEDGSIPLKYQEILKDFYDGYHAALHPSQEGESQYSDLFMTFLELIRNQCLEPYQFQPYHERIRTPFDYYQFGIDLISPLVDRTRSSLKGQENLKEISALIAKGDNVIFLANHQIEADPQAISILLEDDYPELGEKMIFVAGERVITDPLAAPSSMGRNLLCIYSKRYIDHPPEQKLKKQLHNKRTMELMSALLSEGGKAIYVAPSGGRDRPNAQGVVEVAPFDPQSIEMFYLMTQRAGHPSHFYPLSLKTYELLPPPETIQVELGETRITRRGGIHLSCGQRINMENFPGHDIKDKHERRQARADFICNLVRAEYLNFPV